MPLRERERERERFFFFCPTYGPKRKFRKSRVLGGGKKKKVTRLGTDESEKLKQVVFLMLICTLHPLVHIDIYKSMYSLRYRVLSVYFI